MGAPRFIHPWDRPPSLGVIGEEDDVTDTWITEPTPVPDESEYTLPPNYCFENPVELPGDPIPTAKVTRGERPAFDSSMTWEEKKMAYKKAMANRPTRREKFYQIKRWKKDAAFYNRDW